MAELTLQNELEYALGTPGGGGNAVYKVEPGGTPVDVWERTVKFPPVGGTFSVPDYQLVRTFSGSEQRSVALSIGEMHQVLLYPVGQGRKNGSGKVLARRSFPCVLREGGRTRFMTQCTERPQIDIRPGGTYVSIAVGGAAETMARVQLCSESPFENEAGVPSFTDSQIVANAVSVPAGPKFLHRLTPTDSRLLAGNAVFFVIFTWDRTGHWDYIWHTEPNAGGLATAPDVDPETVTLRKRTVTAKLVRLGFLDDSDALSNGEGSFTFVLRQDGAGGQLVFENVVLDTFETNTSLTIDPPKTLTFGQEVVTPVSRYLNVEVYGHDDDTDTFPADMDEDDSASTDKVVLDMPIGENLERVTDRFLSLQSHVVGGDDTLSFVADVIYSVSYA